jgi:small subunit ribosomal protein S8
VVNDTISDMLTRLRNANLAKHQIVEVPSLKYKGKKREPIITALKRISKPGLRVYANRKELPRVLGGLGIAVISTSQGVMTDNKARHQGLGGEVLCYVW